MQLNTDNFFLQDLSSKSKIEIDSKKVADSIVGITKAIQYPKVGNYISAVGKILPLIPGLSTLGGALVTLAPLAGTASWETSVTQQLKSIDQTLAAHQKQTLSKLDNIENLLRNNNCQGSIQRQMELIDTAWNALLKIPEAEKISKKQGESQRNLFYKVCSNGASCFTATKGLLEIIGNRKGASTSVFGKCSLIDILNKGDK